MHTTQVCASAMLRGPLPTRNDVFSGSGRGRLPGVACRGRFTLISGVSVPYQYRPFSAPGICECFYLCTRDDASASGNARTAQQHHHANLK
jgi:hypothetical protein